MRAHVGKILFSFVVLALVLALIVGVLAFRSKNASINASKNVRPTQRPTEPSAATSPPPDEKPLDRAVASAPSVAAPQAPRPDVLPVLKRYSANHEWQVETDTKGRPTRLLGGDLNVMKAGDKQDQFISEFVHELGFSSEPKLDRKLSSTGSFDVLDLLQSQPLSDGKTYPVFEAWLRLKGKAETGAFLVNNFLKPLSNTIRADLSLKEVDAIQIAKQDFPSAPDSTFGIYGEVVIYADGSPQQLVSQVVVEGPLPHWLLLIGHETRSIVHKQVVSRE